MPDTEEIMMIEKMKVKQYNQNLQRYFKLSNMDKDKEYLEDL